MVKVSWKRLKLLNKSTMFRKCCDRVVEVIEKIELCYYMVIFARERAMGLSRVDQK